MQRNNGAGGSLKRPIKSTYSNFCDSLFQNGLKSQLNPVSKSTCIIPQIPIYISKKLQQKY